MDDLYILSESFEKIKNYLDTQQATNTPFVKFKNPSELTALINFEVEPEAVSEEVYLKLWVLVAISPQSL